MALVSAVLKTEGVFRSLQAVLHCNQYLSGRFLMSRLLCSSPSDPLPTRVQQAFKMLGLEEEHGGSVQQVRKAFIRMVKRFHPDAQTTEASAEEFAKIREAYKQSMLYVQNAQQTRQIMAALEQEMNEMEDTLEFRLLKRHRVAHRHYLDYDVGAGTYSEREKMHKQLRFERAQDHIFERQMQKSMENKDEKMVGPYLGKQRNPRITQTLERLADDLIRESMARGEFDRLQGKGKPLRRAPPNPVLDNVSQHLNQMLINSGFTPEWVMLGKEIRSDVLKLRRKAAELWQSTDTHPPDTTRQKEWERVVCEHIQPDLKDINIKVDKYNLSVPSLSQQMAHISATRLLAKVTSEKNDRDSSGTPPLRPSSSGDSITTKTEDTAWGAVRRAVSFLAWWTKN